MSQSYGARWWRVDVHAHTPASTDYGKRSTDQTKARELTPADWLRAYMRAAIDAVVITDHNSGDWIDRLKTTLSELRTSADSEFRELTLFPGVEITANGGAHIIAVLPCEATTTTIASLLGAVDYRGVHGASDIASPCSPLQVVEKIIAAGGIPILAHVDAANSALMTSGNSLAPLLEAPGLHAMEVCDASWTPPQLYQQRRLAWSRVLGSDSHHPNGTVGQRFPGSHFTWVKMETPSHEGLRLAILDGNDISIRRSDQAPEDQNRFTHVVIDRLVITEARYAGRGTPTGSNPLQIPLSPWLTTIIGGRGSGKSTVVELMRLALRREDDVPEAIKPEFEGFKKIASGRDERAALTEGTQIEVIFRKDGHNYRVRWASTSLPPAIEEQEGTTWTPSVGDIRQRFPVRIFSQGQIFALARDSRALLNIITDAREVDLARWRTDWQAEEGRFLSMRAKLRELDKLVSERSAIEGRLDDVTHKLSVFEQAEHAQVLKDYQRSQHQRRTVDAWTTRLAEVATQLQTTADRLTPPDFDIDILLFEQARPAESAMTAALAASLEEVKTIAARVDELANEARERRAAWVRDAAASRWSREADQIDIRYRGLVEELSARGVSDVAQYGVLVQQRNALEERLRIIDGARGTIVQLRMDAANSLAALTQLREELTAQREAFVSSVLQNNPHVRMTVKPYGDDPRACETGFRKAIDRGDGKHADDILSDDGTRGCLADLYRDLPTPRNQRSEVLSTRIAALKERIESQARDSTTKGWFAKHLQQLPPEALDRLQLWFPPDELVVSYSPRGDGRGFRSLEQGSRGQKAAAILAFLLAHGDEPIILDQPEDDLDNELIYELIVAQLRSNKLRRQVIVVTHNPNIVVNGDAELILVMENTAGQCRLPRAGSLQSGAVRDQVCAVMEGGREALEKRYRRIMGTKGG